MSIKWSKESVLVKIAVCELCGWNNKTSKRIAATSWENLAPATKKTLLKHGITE
jgi:hypothetical protein